MNELMFASVLIFHFQLLVEDIQTRTSASIVKIDGMLKQFKANLPPPPESLFCVATESKNCDIYGCATNFFCTS
jgi:hypothetical protein